MRNKGRGLFIIALLVIALGLSGAYALLANTLNITGTAQGLADFKIAFTTASVSNPSKETATISTDGLTLTIAANLSYPGDTVTTNFTITNVGKLAATVSRLTTTNNSNPDITVTINGLDNIEGTTLSPNDVTTGSIVVTWNASSTITTPQDVNFSVTLDYLQATV